MDRQTIRLQIRDQTVKDGDALFLAGIRLCGRTRARIEKSGDAIVRSRARLILSRVRVERSKRWLPPPDVASA
jgi:hypothetical protein